MKPTLCLLFPVLLTACGGGASSAPAPATTRSVPVRTAAVERRDLEDTLRLTGTLKPRAQVEVVAQISARLIRILKDEGDFVAADEVIAVLDETDFRLADARAKAALALAEANRAHTVTEKERAENLIKTGGITDKDLLTAQVNVQVAEAAVAQARAEESMAGGELQKCRVKAPFAGRVAKRHVDPGAVLTIGTAIFTLVDNSVLEFRASAPSATYGKIQTGAPVEVEVDAFPGLVARGRVARITPWVDERSRAFEVVVEVPGAGRLVGGLFARAAIRLGKVTGALVVPPAALIRDGARPGEADAYVVVNGKAERRKLELGVEGPDVIQVKKGLEADEIVILDPPVALSAGAPVEIQDRAR